MRKPAEIVAAASAVVAILGALTLAPAVAAAEEKSITDQGREIAFDRKKGNCLACHQIEGGELPGNIGPPLVAMKARFPDKGTLRAQIYDATTNNPNTLMPPFGRHEILNSGELDKVVEFIHSL